jgi:anti-anti-sigma factor
MSRLDVVVDRLPSGVPVVRLSGELVYEHAYTLDVQLQKLEDADSVSSMVLDLRGLYFLDSAGLSRLLAARRRAGRAKRRLVLVRGTRNVSRVMMLAGIHDAFELVDDIPSEMLAPA